MQTLVILHGISTLSPVNFPSQKTTLFPPLQKSQLNVTAHRLLVVIKLRLKTNFYSAIKSKDSEALESGTSQLSSQREYGEIKMF